MKIIYGWMRVFATHLGAVIVGLTLYSIIEFPNTNLEPKVSIVAGANTTVNETVTALGRVQPKDKVISLSASSDLVNVRVAQISVKEGDKVKQNQVVAVLDNIHKLKATLEQAKQKVEVVKAKLLQVKAGEAKKGEIAAQEALIARLNAQMKGEISTQKAKIARLRAELLHQIDAQAAENTRLKAEWQYAKAECDRYDTLFQSGAVSASARESKCLAQETALERVNAAEANKKRLQETLLEQVKEGEAEFNQILSTFPKQISEAKANLNQMTEVRPVDVQVVQAELQEAESTVLEAEANLNLAYIKAPFDGQILKIYTFPGERISSAGIVDLAQTEQMYVIAEVYETEINKIKLGQKATISSKTLSSNLTGIVDKIGLQIGKKEVFNNDPTLAVDARVIEVKIRLLAEDSQRAASLINLEVEVAIDPNI